MNSKKTLITISALLIAAIALSVAAFGNSQMYGMGREQGLPVDASQQSDGQTATIEINTNGFEPSSLKLKAGAPAKVTFVRKTDETCAKEVVMKDYDVNRKLPLNEPVTVEFTPRKGEFAFGCGMSMLKDKLIVE
jgi:plastocyanin domain-containing protein